MRPILLLLVLLCFPFSAAISSAQKPNMPHQPDATVVRTTTVYLEGDAASQKLGTVEPGRELAILEHNGPWLRVFANIDTDTARTDDQPVFSNETPAQPLSGWIQDQNVVDEKTPNGQALLFGEAASYEQAASQTPPLTGAALDARRLYRMAVELFPKGDRTAEAMWRSADIHWQLQKAEAATLPSAHEKENYLREQPDEREMRSILNTYPNTKWASFAAYDLIDNKLCGDWQGSEKCPEQEAHAYAAFADHYPDSPRSPGALFEAAWRLACAGDMWAADDHPDRATEDRKDAVATAEHLVEKYPATDDAARGTGLIYKVERGIPIYGSDRK